jgi:hypothetical protein
MMNRKATEELEYEHRIIQQAVGSLGIPDTMASSSIDAFRATAGRD